MINGTALTTTVFQGGKGTEGTEHHLSGPTLGSSIKLLFRAQPFVHALSLS